MSSALGVFSGLDRILRGRPVDCALIRALNDPRADSRIACVGQNRADLRHTRVHPVGSTACLLARRVLRTRPLHDGMPLVRPHPNRWDMC